MKKIFNFVLALASTSPMIFVYAINAHICLLSLSPWLCYCIIASIILITNAMCMLLFRLLSKDSIEGQIRDIELANNVFLPNYLGYFFVSVSITDMITFCVVYFLTVVLVTLSQTMYFNPFFLFMHYNFYHVTNMNGTRLFLITKRKIRTIQADGFQELRRINDVTYIDL